MYWVGRSSSVTSNEESYIKIVSGPEYMRVLAILSTKGRYHIGLVEFGCANPAIADLEEGYRDPASLFQAEVGNIYGLFSFFISGFCHNLGS